VNSVGLCLTRSCKRRKSISNSFNQTVVSYDASKDEKVDALKKKNTATEQRLRDKQ